MISGRVRTVELPVHQTSDGRQFIADRDVIEADCFDFIDRYSNYWIRDDIRCGWLGPIPDGRDE